MDVTNFTLRVDKELKQKCEELYSELGINLTTAINVFLRQSLRAGGFPFDVRLNQPNKETLIALLEAEALLKNPETTYYDLETALNELKK